MRDERIDILRAVGLALIILAHVHPPAHWLQLRTFDVPLLVLLSGASFQHAASTGSYGGYVWHRLQRLVLPVWLFLTIYFLTLAPWCDPEPLTTERIMGSYLLSGGIGYVWVIRVFLLVALLAPLLRGLEARCQSLLGYLGLLAAAVAANELLLQAWGFGPGSGGDDAEGPWAGILYVLPYGALFALGLRLPRLGAREVAVLAVGAGVLCGAVGWLGRLLWRWPLAPQAYKYPPAAYYVLYGIAGGALAWWAGPWLVALGRRLGVLPGLWFVARNSIWIYLWHIPFVTALDLPFYWEYAAAAGGAVALTAGQVALVERFLLPRAGSEVARRWCRVLLTG